MNGLEKKPEKLVGFISALIPFLIGCFILLNPIPHTTALKEICFYTATALTALLTVWKKIPFRVSNPLTIPFSILLVWVVLDICFALNRPNTIHDIYAHLIKYIILFYLIVNFFSTRERLNYFLWIIMSSAALFSLGGVVYMYLTLHAPITTKLGIGNFKEVPSNVISVITLPAIIFSIYFLSRWKGLLSRIFISAGLVLTFAATLLSQARSALVAALISLALLFPKNKKVLLSLIPVLILGVLLSPMKNLLQTHALVEKLKADHRLGIVYLYSEIAKDYPLTGIGFGMQTYYDEALLTKYNSRVPSEYRIGHLYKAPHNILVDVLVRTGLVGLVIYLWIFWIYAKISFALIKNGKTDFTRSLALCSFSCFMAYFIIGMFENVLSGPPAIVQYWILAVTTILWNLDRTGFVKQAEPS